MQASSFWKRFIGTVDSDDLADLRRDMILEVGVVALVIGCGGRAGHAVPSLDGLATSRVLAWPVLSS